MVWFERKSSLWLGAVKSDGNKKLGLIDEGGLFGPAISDDGEWYRIFTSGFLHANLIHLLFNMYVLYILGTLLEPAVGAARMVGIYVVSLVAGSFGALLLTPDALTVGASGAVYALGAAFGALSSSNTGRNLNLVLIVIFSLRLMLGGGLI